MAERERLRLALDAAAADRRPAPVVLMHLLMQAGDAPGLGEALAEAARTEPAGDAARRLGDLSALLARLPDAPALVRSVLAEADHARGAPEGADPIAHWSGVFDRIAALSPAAGAALYSFGDAGLLAQATAEIVNWLDAAGLLGPERVVLDLGCGSGRIAAALAPLCALAVGIDASEGMLRAARAGHGALPLVRGSGRDLAAFAASAFDLVVACDVFPYLVQAGEDIARRHLQEVARVLRPGGQAVAFNLSYRGDAEQDSRDAARWGEAAGLACVSFGQRPLATWDGVAVRWRR